MSDSTHAGPAQASDPRQHLAQQSSRDELLPCQWTGCAERCQTAEQLYDHVCERHVGRKSTNNLNLTCGWGTCRTATVKRDHITSHIRVHVPLKPHRCDFCGKSFKRPQDLKKHVKTHADDSVLLRTPEPPHRSQNQEPGYRVENGKVITDLQALAATATGYYENPAPQGNVVNHGYGHQGPSTHNGYYGSQQPPYGPVYYAVNQGHGGRNPAFDSRKRGYEILDNFLGDVKRRQFDPTSSVEVGQRLFALQGLQLPEDGLMTDYQTAPAMVQADGHGSESQHQYALPPMHNLRTKNELMHIDQFLEQMQATVYESSNQAAAAGVAQPGAVFVSGGVNYEQGHSPPHGHSISSHAEAQPPTTDATSAAPLTADSSHSGTPALTPPSRSLSYTSAHSPPPAATTQGISPVSRANYPNLPSMGSSGNTLTNALGSNFDDQPRRYSGGMLQKASRAPGDVDMARSEEPESPEPRSSDIRNLHISTSLIDPALAELSSPGQASADGDSAADTAQEMWVQNIRVVETLRKLIAEKLERLDYEDSDDDMADVKGDDESKANSVRDGRSRPLAEAVREKSEADKDAENLYPILRAVEAAS